MEQATAISSIFSIRQCQSLQKIVQVLGDLGQGTFAQVFKVKILQTEQIVAMKQVDVPLLQRQHILKQIQNLQKIENDHIITYYHSIYDITDRNLNILMELCNGSLKRQISSKTYKTQEIVNFLVQMVSAFLQLTDKKLMHLDLKPENILISSSNEGYYKICDFGCSQIAIKSKLSKYENQIFGTFNYLAPQNYLNYRGRFTNTSSDMWSLGIIVYEMIFKTLPFNVDKSGLIKRAQIDQFFKDNKDIEFTGKNSPPPQIIKLLKQMLRPDPKKRISWKELQKLLIQQYNIDEYSFHNVIKVFFKHMTTLKIYLTYIIILRKNIEFNPHTFWKTSSNILDQFAQKLLELCYLFCKKFSHLYNYKLTSKLSNLERQNLKFFEKNIQIEIQKRQQQKNIGKPFLKDLNKYEIKLVEISKRIIYELSKYKEQYWQTMYDLQVFCNQTIKCGQHGHSFFASGDITYYGNTISNLNISN